MPDLVPPAPAAVFAIRGLVLAVADEALHFRRYTSESAMIAATVALLAGDDPRAVFGWAGSRLSVDKVRAVEHVPAAGAVVVWRGWWRDPLRVVFGDDTAASTALFDKLSAWAGCGPPEVGRVGPHDLAMDPGLGLGVLLAFLGTTLVVLGAVEGAGPARADGGKDLAGWMAAAFGETIGFWPAIAVAGCVVLLGAGLLYRWWARRPEAWTAKPARA